MAFPRGKAYITHAARHSTAWPGNIQHAITDACITEPRTDQDLSVKNLRQVAFTSYILVTDAETAATPAIFLSVGWLVFNGNFSTNGLYRAIRVWNILCRNENKDKIKQ